MEWHEGITPRLEQNRWFNENIRPKVKKAYYAEDPASMLHLQIVKVVDEERGRVTILMLKVANNGYIKSTFSLAPAAALEVARKLEELAKET